MDDVEMASDVVETQSQSTSAFSEVARFQISEVINAHKNDVKALVFNSAGTIISGGRDEMIRFWTRKGGEYVETLKLTQPKGLVVNALAFVELPSWRLFVGRKDGSIAVYGRGSSEPVSVLAYHKNNVCCLHVDEKNGVLLSGSWDSHVIVWPIAQIEDANVPALLLEGHSMSIWALATLPDQPEHYLSASADKTIRLWNKDVTIRTFKGHTDVVRALAVVSNSRFISASNDGHVILWDLSQGTALGKFPNKSQEFIYNMTYTGTSAFTVGEEGNLEFWSVSKDEKNFTMKSEFVLVTPATTTWDVKVLPNTDIAVASSDGRIFIFTKDAKRLPTPSLVEAFDAEVIVKLATLNENKEDDPSGVIVIKVALDDGPAKLELRYEKGSDPGLAAEKFIHDNQLPISYLNEITQYICANIPEARSFGSQSKSVGPKTCYVDGVAYDYRIRMKTGDGELLYGFNQGDEPQYVAQAVCEKYNLPISYLGTIVESVQKQQMKTASEFTDPLTGSGRYVPQETPMDTGNYVDPFTGAGRYIPGAPVGAAAGSGFSGDPFTGEGAYKTTAGVKSASSALPIDKKRPRGPFVPIKQYYKFVTIVPAARDKAINKLNEANRIQDAAFLLNQEELSSLELLLNQQLQNENLEMIKNALQKALSWNIVDLLPVVDCLRMALAHEDLNDHFCSVAHAERLTNVFMAILVSEVDAPLKTFTCRAICNAFAHPAGRQLFVSCELSNFVSVVVKQVVEVNIPHTQAAAASALANWSLALLERSVECSELGRREDVLRSIIQGVEKLGTFGSIAQDALLRLLQAIATLMWGDSAVISLAKSRNMARLVTLMKDAIAEESGKEVARDVIEMTYAV